MSSLQPSKDQVMRALVVDDVMRRCVDMIVDAMAYSLAVAPMRRLTRDELKRRFNICYDIWKDLRAEHRYPLTRIESCLSQYLVMSLEGAEWDPHKRRTWVPGDPISRNFESLPTYVAAAGADPKKFLGIFEDLKGYGYL